MGNQKTGTILNRILLLRKNKWSACVAHWFPTGFGWAMICVFLTVLPYSSLGAGTVSAATEAELDAALSGGGTVTFAVDGTITVTSEKIISADTVLDATGHDVTISGGNNVRIFTVTNGVNLTLQHLTLSNGKTSTNGGAIYNRGNLLAFDCVFASNTASGTDGADGDNGADAGGVGQAGNGGAGVAGGSVLGGAVYNEGTLALTGCVFVNNAATAGSGGSGGNGGNASWSAGNGGAGGAGGVAKGGAVYSTDGLCITNCTFGTNSVKAGNSGDGGSGGVGYYFGSNARAGIPGEGSGAGIYANRGCVIVASSFHGNTARGGNAGTNGATTIGFQNDAGRNGGNSLGGAVCNVGTNVVINSTFHANAATGGDGGTGSGAGNWGGGAGGNGGTGSGGGCYSSVRAGMTNCTFSSGGAAGGGGGAGGPSPGGNGPAGGNGATRGANIANNGSVFVLQSCILANPLNLTSVSTNTTITTNITTSPVSTNTLPSGGCSPPTCTWSNSVVPPGCVPPYCTTNTIYYTNVISTQTNVVYTTNASAVANTYGTFTDAGYNLSSDNTPTLSGTSHNVTDPKLGSLADNGGPTRTMLLLAGSPAINAGGDTCLAADQRGFARPSGAHCDIGAVEMQLPAIAINPLSWNAAVGSEVQFTVTVATNDVPLDSLTYQWRFNGTNFAGATNTSFTVSGDQTKDAGTNQVQVVATNYLGAVASQVATLRVFIPIVLATPSFDQTNFWFTFKSETGLIYIVEFKNTLNDTGWTRLSTNVGTGDLLTNGGGVGTTSRFFRVVIE